MRLSAGLVPGLLLACAACVSIRLPVPRRPAPSAAASTLQVPYVAQSVLLCGGAAIAMIERWWGRRGVNAEDFADLVRPAEGGIRTSDLTARMQSRGWTTRAGDGIATAAQQAVNDSVPVIALIRVSDQRYHYVTILAWRDGKITYHDPAVAPFITTDSASFMRRWNGARQWALIATPSASAASATTLAAPPIAAGVADSLPCRPWLDRAADAAGADRLDEANQLLDSAAVQCPAEPLLLRERAGVKFREGKRADAARIADEYSRLVPNDTLGWQLLASSRYLTGDVRGALMAWNRVGRPDVDFLRIDGSRRIRFRALAETIDVTAGTSLTTARFDLAARRLADIPSLASARVAYTAVPGGAVELRALLAEKPLVEPLPELLVGTTVDAVFRRDVHLSLHTPLGIGETWTMQWRWQRADPRIAVRVAIPARLKVPVIVRLERSWETYRFTGTRADDARDAASMMLSGWAARAIEALAGARIERWSERGEFVALAGGIGLHGAHDHTALLLEGEQAIPRSGGDAYRRARVRSAFTPSPDRWRNVWAMRLGAEWASAATPLGFQPLAGGDLARDIPLRAHPFIISGALPATRIGRSIVHGGISGDRAFGRRGPITLGAGIFLDGARIAAGADSTAALRTYIDGGAGLRIGLAGTQWSALRIDVARGFTVDRRWGLTVGLAPAWPIRLGRAR